MDVEDLEGLERNAGISMRYLPFGEGSRSAARTVLM